MAGQQGDQGVTEQVIGDRKVMEGEGKERCTGQVV